MFKKISCFVLALVLFSTLFMPQLVQAQERYDVKVDSYDRFYEVIKETMASFDNKVSIKVENYDRDTYDYGDIIDKILVENPEIQYSYGGATASMRSYYEYQNYRIIDIYFRYRGSKDEFKKLVEVKDYISFKGAIIDSLNSFDDKILIRINNYDKEKYDLDTAIDTVLKEVPDLDYGLNGWPYTIYGKGKDRMVEIYFNYSFSKDKMIEMKEAVDKKAKEIIKEVIKPDMNDFEKELALHDYVISNTKYNMDYEKGIILPEDEHTAYGVLVKGKGVCSSYAKAMHKLLTMVGIESYFVSGTGNGTPHAWNIVKIQGGYYHLDATWNDTQYGEDKISHEYFNLSNNEMSQDHTWVVENYPRANSTLFSYANISKILSGEIEFVSSEDNEEVKSTKELPNNTVVIGYKAFDIEFANNPDNMDIIYNERYQNEENRIYVKVNNKWFNLDGSDASIADIPDVDYTSDGLQYAKFKSMEEEVQDEKDGILIEIESLIAGINADINIDVKGDKDYPGAKRFSFQSTEDIVDIGEKLFVFPSKTIGDVVKVQLYSEDNELIDTLNIAIKAAILPPTNIRIVNLSESEVELNWDEVEGADYYHVYESYYEDGPYKPYADGEGNKNQYSWYSDYSVNVQDIPQNTTLYFKVTAVRNGRESEFSDVVSIDTSSDKMNSTIAIVQEGSFYEYPNENIMEGLSSYFADGKWTSFKSEDGSTVVEFKGLCYYEDELVDILLQFTVDAENKSFYVNYKEIDGEGMDSATYLNFLKKVFDK